MEQVDLEWNKWNTEKERTNLGKHWIDFLENLVDSFRQICLQKAGKKGDQEAEAALDVDVNGINEKRVKLVNKNTWECLVALIRLLSNWFQKKERQNIT